MIYKRPWTKSHQLPSILPDGRGGYPSRAGQEDQGAAQGHWPDAGGASVGGECRQVILWRCRTWRAECHLHRSMSLVSRLAMRRGEFDGAAAASSLITVLKLQAAKRHVQEVTEILGAPPILRAAFC